MLKLQPQRCTSPKRSAKTTPAPTHPTQRSSGSRACLFAVKVTELLGARSHAAFEDWNLEADLRINKRRRLRHVKVLRLVPVGEESSDY